MASFDFIKALIDGYRFMWAHRFELMKFAAPVIFVSVFCTLLILYTGSQENILRQGLIQLPAFFAQGFFASELVRFALFGEHFVLWGYTRHSQKEEFAQKYRDRQLDDWRRSRAQGGMILFVLVNVVGSALLGVVPKSSSASPAPVAQEFALQDLPLHLFHSAVLLFILLLSLWFVRVGFLYISFSMGYGVKAYFERLKGLSSSVSLLMVALGAGFSSFVPALIFISFADLVFKGMPGIFVVVFVVLVEVFKAMALILSTVACSYGIRDMMGGLPRQGAG